MLSRSALLATPIAAALLLGLTACSTSTAAPTSAAAASTAISAAKAAATTASAAPATAKAAASAAGRIDACALVPAATVSKIMNHHYATTKTSGGGDESECDYDLMGGDRLVLLIEPTEGKTAFSADQRTLASLGGQPTAVSGIGDSAYATRKHSVVTIEKAYGAVWGNAYVTVGGFEPISEDQAKQLLNAAHDAL